MQFHNYYVYLLTTSDNSVFYTGFTNDLARRIVEHKVHLNKGFTDRYNITKLVYYELFHNVDDAIKREKQLKRYSRIWKAHLVATMNAEWNDLSETIGVTKEIIESARNGIGVPGTSPGRQC
ncbi:MAG: GIY-YIG nuclease family protein [Fibrobacter sp.]|nr:GIY-YIG nuclease family protein [Fibrobacter sp.]